MTMNDMPSIGLHPAFFNRYIDGVGTGEIKALLKASLLQLEQDLEVIGKADTGFRYAEDKWSINTLVRHCIDTEFIFGYRALCIARKDPNPIRSFEENDYADASEKKYDFAQLTQEFINLRNTNVLMFDGFEEEWMARAGTTDQGDPINVRSAGYIIVGHWLHHRNVLQTKYGITL